MDMYAGREGTTSKSMAVLPQQVVNISQRSVRNVTHMFKASTDNLRSAAFKKFSKMHKSNDKLD